MLSQSVGESREHSHSYKQANMTPSLKMADAKFSGFASDVARGLSAQPKEIPSVWFYDAEGSRLFARITQLPEYYLTRRETEILETHARSIIHNLGSGKKIFVELGAGDGTKTDILLREAMAGASSEEEICFCPIDVSPSALEELRDRISERLPGLTCRPMVCDNLEGLSELERSHDDRICVLFLGSSVGNYSRPEVERQLLELRSVLRPGDCALIGFDLMKDPKRLIRAYDDSAGITREFNLNLLRRMNQELGADFDPEAFRHEAIWNPTIKGMESWLVSLRDQEVRIAALAMTVRLRKWEAIRTEVSLKFDREDIEELAFRTGFTTVARYEDEAGDFADVLWRIDG